jgi:ABC-type Fe3+-siderophore transport system permease subunit
VAQALALSILMQRRVGFHIPHLKQLLVGSHTRRLILRSQVAAGVVFLLAAAVVRAVF